MADTSAALLAEFRETVDPDATLHAGGADLPVHWRGYLGTTQAERLQNARVELRMIGDYFPEATGAIAAILEDAILIDSPLHGLVRVLGRRVDGVVYVAWSAPPVTGRTGGLSPVWPLFRIRAPEALVWVHETVMDGLVDAYGFGGFYPSAMLTTMEDQIDTYGNGAWYDAFAAVRNPAGIVEYFSSGGGAYLLIDLNDDLSRVFEPQAWLVNMKDGSGGPQAVDLFPYLDTWMAMGIGGVVE